MLQTAVNGLGTVYVTAVTAASKVSMFLCCPFDAMGCTKQAAVNPNTGTRQANPARAAISSTPARVANGEKPMRNINASGKPETISTTRRRNEAAALLREKRDQARQRFSALEARLKDFSNANVSYVSVNGISMPVPR